MANYGLILFKNNNIYQHYFWTSTVNRRTVSTTKKQPKKKLISTFQSHHVRSTFPIWDTVWILFITSLHIFNALWLLVWANFCWFQLFVWRFISDGVAQNVRIDGRGRFDYRPYMLETGVISQTNGSARCEKAIKFELAQNIWISFVALTRRSFTI